MIRYALACDHDHQFEGWFASSGDYVDQRDRGLVECPVCGSKAIRKQIMAPAVAGTKRTARDPEPAKMQAMMMEAAGRIRTDVHPPAIGRPCHVGASTRWRAHGTAA